MAKRNKSGPVSDKVAARRAVRKAAQQGAMVEDTGHRTFQGLPDEADWVALREVVPAATGTARTTAEYGSRDVMVATLLPMMWPALHREDGVLMVALQKASSSGDASRDVAAALLELLETEPGEALDHFELPGPGPRLQDVLDLDVPFEVTMYDGFEYTLSADAEPSEELSRALDDFTNSIVPTKKLQQVHCAYWCRMGSKEFLRWARTEDEEQLLDALARLHARRESGLDEGSRFVGAFRSGGLLVPVWELARGSEAEEIEQVAVDFDERLRVALAVAEPLTADERRARAGLVSRQVTLR